MKISILVKIGFAMLCLTALAFAQQSLWTLYRSDNYETKPEVVRNPEPGSTPHEHASGRGHVPAHNTHENKEVSDDVLFELFLIKIISLDKAAAEAESKGESGELWRGYLAQQGFTESEVTAIRQIANEFAAKITPIHTRALAVIKKGRTAHAIDQPLPSPPSELTALQQQRSEVAIQSRDRLLSRLGSETVTKIRELMRANTNSLQIDPADVMNSEERINEFKQRMNRSENRKEVNRND